MILTVKGTSREAAHGGDKRLPDSCSPVYPNLAHAPLAKVTLQVAWQTESQKMPLHGVEKSPDLNATPKINAAKPQASPELKQTPATLGQ